MEKAIAEMKKALLCLYLEVDASIAEDLEKKFNAVIAEILTPQTPPLTDETSYHRYR